MIKVLCNFTSRKSMRLRPPSPAQEILRNTSPVVLEDSCATLDPGAPSTPSRLSGTLHRWF